MSILDRRTSRLASPLLFALVTTRSILPEAVLAATLSTIYSKAALLLSFRRQAAALFPAAWIALTARRLHALLKAVGQLPDRHLRIFLRWRPNMKEVCRRLSKDEYARALKGKRHFKGEAW